MATPYHGNILEDTLANDTFRTVLHTGARSQLVVMSIPPGGAIGEEIHEHVEQTFFFVAGTGESLIDGVTTAIAEGDGVVVPPGAKHNFMNTGTEPWKLYTIYAPPNHIDGRIHKTKADADTDDEDEAFGDGVV